LVYQIVFLCTEELIREYEHPEHKRRLSYDKDTKIRQKGRESRNSREGNYLKIFPRCGPS
jgi:hypothetical protein